MIEATPTELLMIASRRLETLRQITLARKGDAEKRVNDLSIACGSLQRVLYVLEQNAD